MLYVLIFTHFLLKPPFFSFASLPWLTTVISFYHPFLIWWFFAFGSSVFRQRGKLSKELIGNFSWNMLHIFLILREVRKEGPWSKWLEPLLKLENGLDCNIILLAFEKSESIFPVDRFDGLLNLILEVELHGLDGKLNIWNLLESEVYEITVVSVTNLIVIDLNFPIEGQDKCCRKSFAVVFIHSYFDMC